MALLGDMKYEVIEVWKKNMIKVQNISHDPKIRRTWTVLGGSEWVCAERNGEKNSQGHTSLI